MVIVEEEKESKGNKQQELERRRSLRLFCYVKVCVCMWLGGPFTAKVICCLATAAEHPTVSFAEIFCSEKDVREGGRECAPVICSAAKALFLRLSWATSPSAV